MLEYGRFETGAHLGAEGSLEILGGSSTSGTGVAFFRLTVTSHWGVVGSLMRFARLAVRKMAGEGPRSLKSLVACRAAHSDDR